MGNGGESVKININGVVRDMTTEEVKEYQALVAAQRAEEPTIEHTPTVEERVTAVEEKVAELEIYQSQLQQIEEVYNDV